MPSFRTIFLLSTTALAALSAAAPFSTPTSSPATQDNTKNVKVEAIDIEYSSSLDGAVAVSNLSAVKRLEQEGDDITEGMLTRRQTDTYDATQQFIQNLNQWIAACQKAGSACPASSPGLQQLIEQFFTALGGTNASPTLPSLPLPSLPLPSLPVSLPTSLPTSLPVSLPVSLPTSLPVSPPVSLPGL